MKQIDGVPNMLSQLGFNLSITKAPYLTGMTQEVNCPDISAGFATMSTPFRDMPITPDKLVYGDLAVTFKVDENLTNYFEVFNWMKAVAFPNSYDQYREAEKESDGIYSDANLTILTNGGVSNFEYHLHGIFPVSLTGLNFNTEDTDVQNISATVVFKVTDFELRKV